MNEKVLNQAAAAAFFALSLGLFIWWMLFNPVKDFIEHVPGMDNRPKTAAASGSAAVIGSHFAAFGGVPSKLAGSWPRFRGADFDNISKEQIRLADSWPEGGPPILWSIDLGEGHAGPAISDGRVYLLDYDERTRADILRCFSMDDGSEIWQRGYKLYIKRNHGMSRTVPAVWSNYVVTVGPKCHVMCVDAVSGDFKWGLDLVKDFGAEVPLWYTGQCPLIEDSLAVIAVGGKSLLAAVHCETGQIIWETPNPNNWKMSHSSIIPMTINNQKMYVYAALGGIAGIKADGPDAGSILFESSLFSPNVAAPSPVYAGGGRIFITAGYGAGSMMLQVKEKDGAFQLEAVQTIKSNEGLAAEQQTPVLYKGHFFSILPKDAGSLRNQFVCVHPDDCKKVIWTSGKTNRFGLGPYLIADDKFYILDDDGTLTMIEAGIKEYKQLARVKILDGHDAWGPLAIVKGRLLARDSRRLVCIDVRAKI